MNDGRASHFAKGRGECKSLWAEPPGNGAAPSCAQKAKLNGVLHTK
nr:MAG TPA: hypothetical protein [Caudoviricetes sp.]